MASHDPLQPSLTSKSPYTIDLTSKETNFSFILKLTRQNMFDTLNRYTEYTAHIKEQ